VKAPARRCGTRPPSGFDGTILSERGTIQARAKENPGEDGTGAAGDATATASASQGVPGGSGAGNGGVPATKGIPGQNGPAAPPMPSAQTAQADALPADLPDSRDDDVVARQLREAAINETDPVLKEKLWEEYRRYKAGS
jgi:hypothetical protein